jgi:predicted DsbA family dithiol-disulfide isomerase
MEQRVTDAAAGEGLEFRLDVARSGATLDGHRVIHLAAERGLQDQMKERLLRAYFTEGELIGDPQTLIQLAGEVGLDQEELASVLAGDRYIEQVRADERLAAELGISAVPTFVLDRRLGASGAHPPDVLLELLREGWGRRTPEPSIVGGESCGVDGC